MVCHQFVPPKSHTSVSNRNNRCVCVTVQSAKHFPARARILQQQLLHELTPVGLWWPWLARVSGLETKVCTENRVVIYLKETW